MGLENVHEASRRVALMVNVTTLQTKRRCYAPEKIFLATCRQSKHTLTYTCSQNDRARRHGKRASMFDQVIISFIGRVYRYVAFTPKGYVSFHPSQYHVGPFSGLYAIQQRGGRRHRGYQANKKRVLYFFWPVAPERVSEMLWPALPRASWACFMTPWPWADASSPPERVASPIFCPADFWPSGGLC